MGKGPYRYFTGIFSVENNVVLKTSKLVYSIKRGCNKRERLFTSLDSYHITTIVLKLSFSRIFLARGGNYFAQEFMIEDMKHLMSDLNGKVNEIDEKMEQMEMLFSNNNISQTKEVSV